MTTTATHEATHEMNDRVLAEQVDQVSRSFSFVIRQLREPLRREVRVGYLLFRLGDNIEDTSSLDAAGKARLLEGLLEAFAQGRPFREALEQAGCRTWADLTPGETALFEHTDAVIGAFGRLAPDARESLLREAGNMFRGMARVQQAHRRDGFVQLPDAAALEAYCYYVAGTVGDYLTDRFLAQLPWLDPPRRAQLLGGRRALALVLQVTNITRDVRDDYEHGHVFYPASLFDRFSLDRFLEPEMAPEVLKASVRMARWLMPQIRLASAYIQALPHRALPLRTFCTIPYVMAVKTLTLSAGNPAILGAAPVKMDRRTTARTLLLARAAATSNLALRAWFAALWAELESTLDARRRDAARAAVARLSPEARAAGRSRAAA